MVDSSGKIVRETKVASEPEALLRYFADLGFPVSRVGLEAGPLSQWLRDSLAGAGLEVVLHRQQPPQQPYRRPHAMGLPGTTDPQQRGLKTTLLEPVWEIG